MDLTVKFHGSSWGCLKALHGSGGRWSSAAARLEPWKHVTAKVIFRNGFIGRFNNPFKNTYGCGSKNPVPPVNLKVDGHPLYHMISRF